MAENPEEWVTGAKDLITRAHAGRQYREALATDKVTCGCGTHMRLRLAFRCYYCGCYFCATCAGVHFGESREDYAKRRAAERKDGEKCYNSDE